MLDAKKDRLDYSLLLTPESDYKLEFALTTTYSLDLKTLIEVLLPLGLLEESDNREVHDKIFILRALKKMTDKLIVFTDSSQIKIPKDLKTKNLMLLLEKMIIPVNTDSELGIYPSFHPKCWLLKYIKQNENPIYKFIILSRNLTNDRSWDTAISFLGRTKKSKSLSQNQSAITDFVEYLIKQLSKQNEKLKDDDGLFEIYKNKKIKLKSLKKELENVEFELPEGNKFEIMPVGINKDYSHISESQLFDGKKNKFAVMSPFVSTPVIKKFETLVPESEKITLITRLQELAKIKDSKELAKTELYIIKPEASIENYLQDEDEVEEEQFQDIHAKIYVEEINTDTNLYLGSVNASSFAQKHNVEMAVKIVFSKKDDYSVNNFLEDISCGYWFDNDNQKLNPFRKVTENDFVSAKALEKEDQNLSDIIKAICRCNSKAEAINVNEEYQLKITFDNVVDCIKSSYQVFISPFGNTSKSECITQNIVSFSGLKIAQISQLYKIRVESENDKKNYLEKTIIIPTKFSLEDRDNAIERGVFETQEDFCKYLSLLLDDNVSSTIRELNSLRRKSLLSSYSTASGSMALYERLLKCSLNKDEFEKIIREIDELIIKLGDKKAEIVPEEIQEIVKIFKKVS